MQSGALSRAILLDPSLKESVSALTMTYAVYDRFDGWHRMCSGPVSQFSVPLQITLSVCR